MPPWVYGRRSASALPAMTIITDFYKEEFLKQQKFLQSQREYYSERAVANAEAALGRVLSQIDALCTKQDADRVVGRLLRSFDVVTGVSALSDSKNFH